MPLNPFAPEWRPALGPFRASITANDNIVDCSDYFDLAALPSEVIVFILSFLEVPRDLANCICASKLLKRHLLEAELCLDMRETSRGFLIGEDMTSRRMQAVLGFCKYVPGTVALLLPNVPLEDVQLEQLLVSLPRLQLLDISGGRKITHAGAACCARANSRANEHRCSASGSLVASQEPTVLPDEQCNVLLGGGRIQPMRVLNAQRCFQLHSGSLAELLAAPSQDVLALSHLDLGLWPNPSIVSDTAAGVATRRANSGLRVLALHNCFRLHGGALASLAVAYGGGSPANGVGTGSSALSFLLLGGSTLAMASFVGSNPASQLPILPPRAAELLSQSYKPAPTGTAATAQAHLAAARHLVATALAMPKLVALELSFFPPPLVECVCRVLADSDAIGREPIEVWDFALGGSDVQQAAATLRRILLPPRGSRDSAVPVSAGDVDAPNGRLAGRGADVVGGLTVATVLRCAVNCSSVTRSTPLHVAAERGKAARVGDLLAAGAVVDARDTAGSSALFLAAEAGHTAVLQQLLAAGADPRLGNAAGETPLYISALRGHLGCVQALVAHCDSHGIAWRDPELYGDAWTPLHAAAVANRADVAACLLQAAGKTGAGELVLVPNKYGQSVLHIAARKGSSQLLRLLLSAGGVAVVGFRDGSGDTPVDVAKKNRHVAALAEFRRLTGVGQGVPRSPQSAATAMA